MYCKRLPHLTLTYPIRTLLRLKPSRFFWHTVNFIGATTCCLYSYTLLDAVRLSVGSKYFSAVAVYVAGLRAFGQVTVDKDAEDAGKGVGGFGFAEGKEGKLPCPAGLTQGGGGVKGVQIGGLGKNNRNNVIFRKMVFFQKGIVQQRNLLPNIFRRVHAPGRPPQGVQSFFTHTFPPAATIMNESSMEKKAPIMPVTK